jgi:hypothetical protein
MAFVAPPSSAQGPTLEGPWWHVVGYFDGGRIVSPLSSHNIIARTPDVAEFLGPALSFAGGRLWGLIGCSTLRGHYELSDHVATISASAPLLLGGYCPPELDQIRSPVLRALNGIRSVETGPDEVILRDQQGVVEVVLAR